MKVSCKYKFILSFLTIEIIFISLIVFFNFSSLNNLSQSLVKEKNEASGKLFSELITTPLIVDDLATLDDALKSFTDLKHVVAVKVFDNQNRVLSHLNDTNTLYKKIFKARKKELEKQGRTFRLSILPIMIGGRLLGRAEIIFEITQSLKTIKSNRNWTFFLILMEMLSSITVAYFIGYRLTRNLNKLTSAAEKIADDDQSIIPNVGRDGDEISVLSKALRIMQQRIAQRNSNLKELVNEVQVSSSQLLKERNFYTALLNNANNIILVMNTKGEIVLSNKAIEKFIGYTHTELKGKLPWEIFIPKDARESVKKVFLSLEAGNFPSAYENVLIAKNGSDAPFAWSNSCIVDKNGDIEYVIAVGIDMTERKKIDQMIRALLNSPLDSIILISIDGTILEINEIAAHRFKKSVKELKGRKIFEFFSDDLKRSRQRFLNQLIKTKKAITFEEAAHGNIFKNHIYPIVNDKGEVAKISIFSHDITARRKEQRELQKYIELVDENILISHLDLEGVTTSVSQAFCKISGYSNEALIGKEYNTLHDSDTPLSVYEDLWKTIQSAQTWHGEIKNRAKDGQAYWLEVAIYPDFNDNGEIIGYYAIYQDITNKKLIEELSITDALTQLYNRRHFDELFYKEVNSAKREKRVFALLSLDVDYFKKYNDTYGHQMGDDVLFSIAKSLKEDMKRSSDSAFRMGGEEFSAIYSIDEVENVLRIAEKIRLHIEEKKIEHKQNSASAYVTISIGVSYIDFEKNPDFKVDKDLLYKYSDDLLYKAKNSGRNKVVVEEFDC